MRPLTFLRSYDRSGTERWEMDRDRCSTVVPILFTGVLPWALYPYLYRYLWPHDRDLPCDFGGSRSNGCNDVNKEWGGMGTELPPTLALGFRRFSLSSAWVPIQVGAETSLWKMTSSWRSGAAWIHRNCCGFTLFKTGSPPNQSSGALKRNRFPYWLAYPYLATLNKSQTKVMFN